MVVNSCHGCGRSIAPARQYCSSICRGRAWRERREQEAAYCEEPSSLPPVGVPVAVVAHPARLRAAEDLTRRTMAEALVLDDDGYGATGNHRRALNWLALGWR